jgi:hypothetical protein
VRCRPAAARLSTGARERADEQKQKADSRVAGGVERVRLGETIAAGCAGRAQPAAGADERVAEPGRRPCKADFTSVAHRGE